MGVQQRSVNEIAWPGGVFIIAEVSANHGGSFDNAVKLISEAARCGCDAVKFQLYKPESMTIDSPRFKVTEGPWAGKTLWELYSLAQTPWEWMPELKARAETLGLAFIVSVYDPVALEWAENNCPPWAYKIASFELTDHHLLRLVRDTGRRTILSTGMADLEEIQRAIDNLCRDRMALLHCVTAYPASAEGLNLIMINQLWRLERSTRIVGFSDHTDDTWAAPLAVAAGARVIEKHIRFDRVESPDASFSLGISQLRAFVDSVRLAFEACLPGNEETELFYRQFRRSAHAIQDIKAGQIFTSDNVRTLRWKGGEVDLGKVWGRKAEHDYGVGDAVI